MIPDSEIPILSTPTIHPLCTMPSDLNHTLLHFVLELLGSLFFLPVALQVQCGVMEIASDRKQRLGFCF